MEQQQKISTENQLHLQTSGSITKGKEIIFHTDSCVELDGLTWAVWGEAAEKGIQMNIWIKDFNYGALRCSTDRSFPGNSPYNIAAYPAPQWTVLEYDTGTSRYAFNFNETPARFPEGCRVEMEHTAEAEEVIHYSIRLRGRDLR